MLGNNNVLMDSNSGINIRPYITSHGQEYIDTGFIPNQDTRVVIKAGNYPAHENDSVCLFGARSAVGASDSYGFITSAGSPDYYRSDYFGENLSVGSSYSFTEPFIIDKNKNVTYINGTQVIEAEYKQASGSRTMYLFAYNTGGAPGTPTDGVQIYYCKIYDNGTLIRDYIPCRDPDGVACFWDNIAKEYVYNAGSGEFTDDQTPEITSITGTFNNFPSSIFSVTLNYSSTDGLKSISLSGTSTINDIKPDTIIYLRARYAEIETVSDYSGGCEEIYQELLYNRSGSAYGSMCISIYYVSDDFILNSYS